MTAQWIKENIITRESVFEKKHSCGFIFSKLCYTPIFLVHIPYSAEYTRQREHQKIQRGASIQVQ